MKQGGGGLKLQQTFAVQFICYHIYLYGAFFKENTRRLEMEKEVKISVRNAKDVQELKGNCSFASQWYQRKKRKPVEDPFFFLTLKVKCNSNGQQWRLILF